MIICYYSTILVLTIVCSIIYFWKWQRNFELCFSIVFMLVPFVNAGYLLAAVSDDIGEAITATKITYLGGCFLILLIMISIVTLCKINMPKWVVFLFTLLSASVYAAVMTIGHSDIFYKDVKMVTESGVTVLKKSYGPIHSVFYVMIFLYFAISVVAIIYGIASKKEASRKNLFLLSATEAFAIFAFFVGRAITDKIEWIPLAYLFDAVVYLFIVDRLALYDLERNVSEKDTDESENAVFLLDNKRNLLCSNESAKILFPDLRYTSVDGPIPDGKLKPVLDAWINEFKSGGVSKDPIYKDGSNSFIIKIGYIGEGTRKRGYRIEAVDDTNIQDFIDSISDYNKKLRDENLAKDKLIEDLRGTYEENN